MKAIKYVFVLLVVIAIASGASAKIEVIEVKEGEKVIVGGNNNFALRLYAKLRAREGNLFFSAAPWAGAPDGQRCPQR